MTQPIDVAIIPPGALASQYCEGRRFQMALAGELVHNNGTAGPNPHYVEYYNQAWKSLSGYWLLDNGAWEGDRLNNADLLSVANRYGATELVAPDVIRDPSGTLDLTKQFLDFLIERTRITRSAKPWRLAAVAHGESITESMEFIAELNAYDSTKLIKTISISRTTCYRSGNPTARFELALQIKQLYDSRYDIHLLGFSDHWPTELQHCASVSGLVRSMDTIAPFSFAYKGLSIAEVGKIEVERPDDYFNLTYDDFDHELLAHNIRLLDQWGRTTIPRMIP